MTSGEYDQERIEAMVRWYRSLAATKSEIEAQMAAIVSEISEAVDVGWSIEVDGIPAAKRKGRRSFSLPIAVTFLNQDERDELKVTQFDAKGVRELIETKGLLEECMEDTGANPSVVLR